MKPKISKHPRVIPEFYEPIIKDNEVIARWPSSSVPHGGRYSDSGGYGNQLGKYKSKYVCFRCRKIFKRWGSYEIDNINPEERVDEVACPDCDHLMNKVGVSFKAPKKSDRKSWSEAEELYNYISFSSIGEINPVKAKSMKELLEWKKPNREILKKKKK
jgi:DNA-directed RNA polymerase subunit RPC12/RpoP